MARRLALTAALLAALLPVAGAGGAGAQRPRVGGPIVFGNLAEPACLNVLIAACTSEATRYITELILLPAFDVSPQHTYRPRLVSGVTITKKPPFTLTYHIRPAARWSDGVHVTARDFLFTHDARLAMRKDLSEGERRTCVASVASAGSTRRRFESSCAPATRAGARSSETCCPHMHLRVMT